MISVAEAFETIIKNIPPLRVQAVPAERCYGRVLASDVVSDIAMPPFDRSAMDGFALRGVCGSYELLPEIPAGADPLPVGKKGQAAPIMTGAPVPEGADRVVMVEFTRVSKNRLFVEKMPCEGENICYKAEDIEKGQTVLRKGTLLTPAEIGIASMAGRRVLPVYRKPSVAVVTTGSEVVPPVHMPRPGQVRNANGSLMESHLRMNGFPPAAVIHSGDDPASLKNAAVQAALVSDFVVTAGGVSMGTRDWIPHVFQEMGYSFLFRTVAQKPGKPFSFAMGKNLMFGLPGNPVSVLVALEMYVLPALRCASGHTAYRKKTLTGKLETPLTKKPGRQYFFRCTAAFRGGSWILSVPESSGSGDLMSAGGVNGIGWLSPESTEASPGDDVPFALMSWAGGESNWA